MIGRFKNTKRDPSDWLSPILVKELRQGMRGRVFLGSFLLLQVAMVFCAAGGLIAASLGITEQFEFFSGLFWFIIGLPLILIIPTTGRSALRNEIDNKSLELITLTHLTPWRIVAGKWAALFAQALLFVFAVLPYLVLRYFLGGIDLMTELLILFSLLLACALLTGMTVGFSASAKRTTGAAFVLIYVVGGQFLVALMFTSPFFRFFSSSIGLSWAQNPLILITLFAPLLLLLLLEVGTSAISPPAEPRSLFLRGLGLLFLLIAAILEFVGSQGIALGIASLPLFMIAVAALTEKPRWIKSVYAPYVRRGTAGRILGRFLLYPGWPSGVLYVLFLAILYGALMKYIDSTANLKALLLIVTILIFPVAVTRILSKNTERALLWFFIIQLIQAGLISVAVFLNKSAFSGLEFVFAIFPTSQVMLLFWDFHSTWTLDSFAPITATVLAASLIALFLRAWPLRKTVREMEANSVRLAVQKPAVAEA